MIISSSDKLKGAVQRAVVICCITMLPATLYTSWALMVGDQDKGVLEWAIKYGAVGPFDLIKLEDGWRFLCGPMLHANINHLLSNSLLVLLGAAALSMRMDLAFGCHDQDQSPINLGLMLCLWQTVSGVMIALIRFLFDLESWSIGASGASLSTLTLSVTIIALSESKRSKLWRILLVLGPLIISVSQRGAHVDMVSHLIGVALGVIAALIVDYPKGNAIKDTPS